MTAVSLLTPVYNFDIIMKKFSRIISAILVVLALSSCGGPELLSIMPVYIGDTVTSTHHEFSKEDFYVLALYDDSRDVQVTDFEFEVEGMDAGYYIVNIIYKDKDNSVYVPIETKIYPSDFKENANEVKEDTHDHN